MKSNEGASTGALAPECEPLLRAESLVKWFPLRRGITQTGGGIVHAVDNVSFSVRAGQTVGLVGESGCGKSTTARMLVNLLAPTSGRVVVDGLDLSVLSRRSLRRAREHIQIVFQDPLGSLNPRLKARNIVAEPLRAYGRYSIARVQELFELVELDYGLADRRPHEFSGGQRQRLNIARALALNPEIIVLDEPTSALDVSIQAQILTLLRSLQTNLGMTYVIISHDLAVIRQMASVVAVMYLGEIVEMGAADLVFDHPRHPYTCALMSANSVPNPALPHRERIVLAGDPPSAVHPPAGCRFHPRCWKVQQICHTAKPSLATEAGDGDRETDDSHSYACHFPE